MEPLLTKLAEQGVIAIVLALSLSANYFLYKEVKAVNEKRIKEALETRDKIMAPLKAIQATVDLVLQAVKNNA